MYTYHIDSHIQDLITINHNNQYYMTLHHTSEHIAKEITNALNLQEQIDQAFCPDCGTRLEVHAGYMESEDSSQTEEIEEAGPPQPVTEDPDLTFQCNHGKNGKEYCMECNYIYNQRNNI